MCFVLFNSIQYKVKYVFLTTCYMIRIHNVNLYTGNLLVFAVRLCQCEYLCSSNKLLK